MGTHWEFAWADWNSREFIENTWNLLRLCFNSPELDRTSRIQQNSLEFIGNSLELSRNHDKINEDLQRTRSTRRYKMYIRGDIPCTKITSAGRHAGHVLSETTSQGQHARTNKRKQFPCWVGQALSPDLQFSLCVTRCPWWSSKCFLGLKAAGWRD